MQAEENHGGNESCGRHGQYVNSDRECPTAVVDGCIQPSTWSGWSLPTAGVMQKVGVYNVLFLMNVFIPCETCENGKCSTSF